MTGKTKFSTDDLMRGYQQRKDVDITIEQERSKIKEFFKEDKKVSRRDDPK